MNMEIRHTQRRVTDRHDAILDLIRKSGFATVASLVEAFGVSEHTIRRDLDALAEQGLVARVHGGVVASDQGGSAVEQSIPFQEEKRRIGMAAAALIAPGEVVCIDAGSTTLEVARHFPPSGIGVLTNAVNIAYEIARKRNDVDITLTGGSVISGHGEAFGLSGPATLQSLEQVGRVSKTIIGALGVDFEYGITDRWHYLAQVKRKMIEIADTVILVVDASKFGKRYLEAVADLSLIDILVTDQRITEEDLERLKSLDIETIVC